MASMHVARSTCISRIKIAEEQLREVYASDQSIYPAPLTFERLKSWVDTAGDFAATYTIPTIESTIDAGVIVALPIIARHWQDVLVGKLKETDIDVAMLVADDDISDVSVGLHIFHIEKFDSWDKCHSDRNILGRFAEFALEDATNIALRKGWAVLGISGACCALMPTTTNCY
jgi:hypothetical protein